MIDNEEKKDATEGLNQSYPCVLSVSGMGI